MQTTYQTLITNNNFIYSPIQRHLNYLQWRANSLKLPLPLISLELHYNKGTWHETKNDAIYNNFLLENIKGQYLIEDKREIPFFEAHGIKPAKYGEPQKLTNPGTGHSWMAQLYIVEI